MARRIIHDGPINTAVKAWMRGQGIKPEDVRGYTLTYDANDIMTIDVRMFMTDEAPVPKFDADDTPVTLGKIEPLDVDQLPSRFASRFLAGGEGVDQWIRDRIPNARTQWMIVQALIDMTPDHPDGLAEAEIRATVRELTLPKFNQPVWRQAWQRVTSDQGIWRDAVFPMGTHRWIAEAPRAADS